MLVGRPRWVPLAVADVCCRESRKVSLSQHHPLGAPGRGFDHLHVGSKFLDGAADSVRSAWGVTSATLA